MHLKRIRLVLVELHNAALQAAQHRRSRFGCGILATAKQLTLLLHQLEEQARIFQLIVEVLTVNLERFCLVLVKLRQTLL
jgi:hypothetical protein